MRYTLNLLVNLGLGLSLGLRLCLGSDLSLDKGPKPKIQTDFRAGTVGSRRFRLAVLLTALLTLTACRGLIVTNAPVDLGFVNLVDFMGRHDEALEIDVRYFGTDNFVGERVDSYSAEKIYVTQETATALLTVQKVLNIKGLALKVFDAYRPQQAVDHFVRWAQDLDDVRMKAKYYPSVDKENLFRDGYIASRSGHSRGSTVDLTLISVVDGAELDMGTSWDFFDPLSWPSSDQVSLLQRANRDYLADVMSQAGFRPLKEEWWHFTLDNEPYPDRYFNFRVE